MYIFQLRFMMCWFNLHNNVYSSFYILPAYRMQFIPLCPSRLIRPKVLPQIQFVLKIGFRKLSSHGFSIEAYLYRTK